jgi:hypothetical protein
MALGFDDEDAGEMTKRITLPKYKPRGASPLRHFSVMFLVKGAERRGQWITGTQKDLTLRWLRIY